MENTISTTSEYDKIFQDIVLSRNSLNLNESKLLITTAFNTLNKLIKEKDLEAVKIQLSILPDYVFHLTLPSQKNNQWTQTIKAAIELYNRVKNEELLHYLIDSTIKYIQESGYSIDSANAQLFLNNLRARTTELITAKGIEQSADLFCKKSMLLRYLASYSSNKQQKETKLLEAYRCVEKSIELKNDEWSLYLELGTCTWQLVEFEKTEKKRVNRLEDATDAFLTSIDIKQTTHNTFALCNFYKNTHQPLRFLQAFIDYSNIEKYKRRFLRNASLYADAALQLWYKNYSKKITNYHLENAEQYVESAINSGFNDARQILSLAFLKAAKGEVQFSKKVISMLNKNLFERNWTEIVSLILENKNDDDLLLKGFALGISDSGVWNKLGTFAHTFLNNSDLAKSLYYDSLKLNSSNAITLTNLARVLYSTGHLDDLFEAKRLIDIAASCADFRFKWWRVIRELINKKIKPLDSSTNFSKQVNRFNTFSDLLKAYRYLENTSDLSPQQKGFELEKIISGLLDFTIGRKTKKSFQLVTAKNGKIQIDGAFFYKDSAHFIEAKWTRSPVPKKEIILFKEKIIQTKNAIGIIISLNSLAREAFNQIERMIDQVMIIPISGVELEYILTGAISLEDFMERKMCALALDRNARLTVIDNTQNFTSDFTE